MSTICAISTPAGIGGIAVLRVSGPESIQLVDSIFRGKRRLTDLRANAVAFGEVMAAASGNGEAREDAASAIDEVLCTVFRAPHSFTGEDTVEISCHGSIYIQQTILHRLIEVGCRMAEPGEFTRRAFMNGKMDLSQAEAVADLIASRSAAEQQLALRHLKGGISDTLHGLRERLLKLTSLLELELDFSDHEELEFADRSELQELTDESLRTIRRLLSSFRLGNAIKQGIPVAILGPTNAGKSTLLNALLGEEKAIVSDIPGTTRDAIEDTLVIQGVLFRFIDTAGLRATQDIIESIGIQRSLSAAQKAELILFVQDSTLPAVALPEELAGKNVLHVFTHADLLPADAPTPQGGILIGLGAQAAHSGLADLQEAIWRRAGLSEVSQSGDVISSARHYEALCRAKEALLRVGDGLQQGLTGELLSLDLHDALDALGEITGEFTSQEVLSNIFSHFCIGK